MLIFCQVIQGESRERKKGEEREMTMIMKEQNKMCFMLNSVIPSGKIDYTSISDITLEVEGIIVFFSQWDPAMLCECQVVVLVLILAGNLKSYISVGFLGRSRASVPVEE